MKKRDILSNKRIRRIIAYLCGRLSSRHPRVDEISESCDIPRSTTYSLLKRMEDVELIEIRGNKHRGFRIHLNYQNIPREDRKELDPYYPRVPSL